MKKKTIRICFMIIFTLTLTMISSCMSGCKVSDIRQEKEASSEDMLLNIQEKGELVVATEGTWSPWTYYDEDNKLTGYDVEVARKVADELGVKVKFVEGKWESLFAGLDSGRYDIVANGVEVTKERAEKYNFTVPYAKIRTAIIARKENKDIQSFEDLEGKRTANTLSSTYAELAESYGAITVGVADINQAVGLLLSGRADVIVNAETSFYDYMKQHPEAQLKIAVLSKEESPVAFPIRKGETSSRFLREMNRIIYKLEERSQLEKLEYRYLNREI